MVVMGASAFLMEEKVGNSEARNNGFAFSLLKI